MPPCPEHTGHQTKLDEHDRRLQVLETAIFEIRDRLLARPGWTTTVVITTLSMLLAASITLMAANIKSGGAVLQVSSPQRQSAPYDR